jgi:ferredoxin-NADP reductase
MTAHEVVALELEPESGTLPTAHPGAHIAGQLPGGLVRHYSLVNGPGEQHLYRLGVKRAADSSGGSLVVHDQLDVGDRLIVSSPRTDFVLRRDALRTLLIAGGIGVTPLLSMALALKNSGCSFELHIFARGVEYVAFRDIVQRLEPACHLHLGLSHEETASQIGQILGEFAEGMQTYVCGPEGMILQARHRAAVQGWPEGRIHVELFRNRDSVQRNGEFEVILARSGRSLTVAEGTSLLDSLRSAGVQVESSCERGTCGTCEVKVLEGTPLHQDLFLNPNERQSNRAMMACVSRAISERIVVDL